MLDLKAYAKQASERIITDQEREVFKTVGFDPEELWQLKEMNEKELRLLMVFCGIRVFNEVPLLVLEEDEMRMAYIIWRSDRVKEKKREIARKVERGIKWTEHLLNAAQIWSRSI